MIRSVKQLSIALVAVAGLATLVAARQPARPFDLLITNARIIDGTGGPAVAGSVAVRDGRIAGVGRVLGPAARTIDAGGKVISPGFIGHSKAAIVICGQPEPAAGLSFIHAGDARNADVDSPRRRRHHHHLFARDAARAIA